MSEVLELVKTLPKPKVKLRNMNPEVYQQALGLGLEPWIARILANRPLPESVDLKTWLNPSLKDLDSPEGMADLDKASNRLIQAIQAQECIGIETDHDCDGQTSHAVIYESLTRCFGHPEDKVRSYIGHRLNEGYGLSDPVVDRILADEPCPSVVITADNGSSDEPRIARLKAAGIDVIVTDHHAIPEEGIPKSAFAVLNPTRHDCAYPDPYIAGCMVAWLTMAWTRTQMQKKGLLDPRAMKLSQLLDFIAVGTVADCVSLSRSLNNRIVTRYGMRLLSEFKRPCWRAVRDGVTPNINSEDLGFKIAPMLNSDGRLNCAFGSVSFLLSEDDKEALNWVQHLLDTNQERKAIQNKLTQQAISMALAIDHPDKKSLALFLPDGHSGVHGISASRIREGFGKPTFLFSPKWNDESLISGSGRSTDECHLRDALQWIADHQPGILDKFGGHRGAAGVTLKREHFKAFATAFEQAISQQLKEPLYPLIETDGEFPQSHFDVESVLDLFETLEPFGREFDAPTFESTGTMRFIKWMGQTKTHCRFLLAHEQKSFPCVWFNVKQHEDDDFEFQEDDSVKVVFTVQVDYFRQSPTLKCFVKHVEHFQDS